MKTAWVPHGHKMEATRTPKRRQWARKGTEGCHKGSKGTPMEPARAPKGQQGRSEGHHRDIPGDRRGTKRHQGSSTGHHRDANEGDKETIGTLLEGTRGPQEQQWRPQGGPRDASGNQRRCLRGLKVGNTDFTKGNEGPMGGESN